MAVCTRIWRANSWRRIVKNNAKANYLHTDAKLHAKPKPSGQGLDSGGDRIGAVHRNARTVGAREQYTSDVLKIKQMRLLFWSYSTRYYPIPWDLTVKVKYGFSTIISIVSLL